MIGFDDMINYGEDIPIDTELLNNEIVSADKNFPAKLYIIPIRYRPVFPGIIAPLVISQGRFADAIEKVLGESKTVGLVLIKEDDEKDEINSSDLYSYGTAVKIVRKINLPDGGVNVYIKCVSRFRISQIVSEKKYILADIEYLDEGPVAKNDIRVKALAREVLGNFMEIFDNNPLFTEEMRLTMLNVDEPGKIADFVTSILHVEKDEYQDILETINVKKRLEKVLRLLQKEMEVMAVQKKIHSRINEKAEKQHKDIFLREELKAIRQELGLEDERVAEAAEMHSRAKALDLKGEVKERIDSEIEKLSAMDTNSPEYTVARNYIDVVFSLPWNVRTSDKIDMDRAELILNREHYGLDDVKKRILEFLAIRKLKPDAKGSIICLVGPPGVGKTSLGRSIAKAMNRNFFRISLGGMRDEAEIKGHRRTYIGAMPGRIIQGIKLAKSSNPVFMLDEIDKLGQSFQGDPASALLEVLDQEQNAEFRDYYLDVPFDLSNVLFITTANTLDTIPQVLVDRMEVIRLSGYIAEEKYHIARRYLLPKLILSHGLEKNSIRLNKSGFMHIIDGWARESGVRNLERQIEKICRKTAAIKARDGKLPISALTDKDIDEYLGAKAYTDDESINIDRPGLAAGLAWTSLGGVALTIEALGIADKKNAGLKLTGQLGDVMSESANIAYSHVKYLLQNDEKAMQFFEERLIHLHVPSGATPKDGPSAGITMALALYSLVTGKTVKKYLAMTGELSLTGHVLQIGGVKEKIIAAKRAGMKYVILPEENRKDFAEIPDYLYKGITLYFVKDFNSVLGIALS